MSYVFSKALVDQHQHAPAAGRNENGLAATQRSQWASGRHGMSLDSGGSTANKGPPPPVAAKPAASRTRSTGSMRDVETTPRTTHITPSPQNKRDAFKKYSRSYSVDTGLSSSGPKMGGTFAKLAAQMEEDPTKAPTFAKTTPSPTSKTISAGLYKDKFEAYKARRSLELHGCLPSSMRGNAEQQRKYSLDLQRSPRSPSSTTTPPGVAPKPRRPSVENRRDAFAKNRSMTSPALPTSSATSPASSGLVFGDSYSFTTPSPSNKSRTSSVSLSNQDIFVEESKRDTNQEGRRDSSIFEIDPVQIAHAEKSPATIQMKQDIAKEKSKIHDAKEELDITINELESFVMSLELDKTKNGGSTSSPKKITPPSQLTHIDNNNNQPESKINSNGIPDGHTLV